MALLPAIDTEAAFDALDLDAPAFLDAARDVARRAGYSSADCERIRDGSLPVFRAGENVVLKFFPPHELAACEREACVLARVHGRLPAPAPEVLGDELLDGWRVLVLRRLAGRPWSAVADEMTPNDRTYLAAEAGRLIRALHAVDARPLDPPDAGWPAFLAERRAGAVNRQRQLGLEPRWAEQIEAYLARVELRESPQVLLHTEVMREHLFVERHGDRWRLTGLLDFEPSRIGAVEYEFASVGIFLACGETELFPAFLRAYGFAADELDGELQRRCMAWALLHRYSHLAGYLRRIPPGESARTLDDLARRWWPLG